MRHRATASGHRSSRGFGTMEVLIALSLFSFALLSLSGLFMVAISAGTAAETSSIATNLARARMEELRSMPPSEMIAENGKTSFEQAGAGAGRTYQVHSAVDASNPDFLDVSVVVTWQVAFGSACASGRSGPGCAGSALPQSRTLETRVKR